MPLIERDLSGDTCAVADAVVAGTAYVRSLGADTATVSDLFVRHPLFARVLVDVIVVDDSIRSSSPHVILSDSVVVGDVIAIQRFVTHVRAVTDAADVSDVLDAAIITRDVKLEDAVVVNDFLSVDFTFGYPNRFIYDDATVTDALVVGKQMERSMSDTADVADAIAAGLDAVVGMADTVDVSDVLVRSQVAHRPKPDAVGITDFLDATIPTLADRNPFNRAPGHV